MYSDNTIQLTHHFEEILYIASDFSLYGVFYHCKDYKLLFNVAFMDE